MVTSVYAEFADEDYEKMADQVGGISLSAGQAKSNVAYSSNQSTKGKTTMIEQEALYREVSEIIADVLGLEVADIVPSDRFFQDLGGESIDVLDLGFQCEKRYGAKVPFQELIDPRIFEGGLDGSPPTAALSRFSARFPFVNTSVFENGDFESSTAADRKDLFSGLFTVAAIVGFVAHVIARREAAIGTSPSE